MQAEDGVRDAQDAHGLGDVYKEQGVHPPPAPERKHVRNVSWDAGVPSPRAPEVCLLHTSDAADDLHCVDPGGRRIIKKKNTLKETSSLTTPLNYD